MTKQFDPRQRDIGWVCPECQLPRGADRCDPCLGKLPGVLFACCGHGGKTKVNSEGYIFFENGTTVRFKRLTHVDHCDESEVLLSKELKDKLGQ